MRQSCLVVLAVVVAAACGTPPSQPAAATKAEPPVDRTRLLATADNADGVADRVVSKCAVCGLGMDGSAEHVSSYEGYTFHLCSADCRETFDGDPAAIVARLAKKTL